MREAFRVEYLLMKDAQSSHSKSWDIPIWNVKTSKEIDEDLMVFWSFKVFG
jgi:hypothetical protein